MNGGHAGLGNAALRALADLNDISDDEDSPSFAAINGPAHLGDATRAAAFIASMQCARRGPINFSTNVDMAYNAVLRNINRRAQDKFDEEMDDERMVNASEIRQRYLHSSREDVSDDEFWLLTRFGAADVTSSESSG